MSVIKEELVTELCVHGYHIYINVWVAAAGEELPCEREARKPRTCCSYAVGTSASESLSVIVMVNSHRSQQSGASCL